MIIQFPQSYCNPTFIDYFIQFLLFARKLLDNLDVLMQRGDVSSCQEINKWVFPGLGFFLEERGVLFELNGLFWTWLVDMIRVVW